MTNPVSLASLPQLAGALRFTPGAPPPHNLQSTRQDWAARMGHGVPAARLPGLMASLFNLCSHAHRLCSQLAIGAAAPGLQPPPDAVAERLRRETAAEHIRRIGLDWPRLLAPGDAPVAAQAATALRSCPWPAQNDTDPWPALRDWLQHALLHRPAADWLAAWQAGGTEWLDTWGQRHGQWLPLLLRRAHSADAFAPLTTDTALRPHGHPPSLCTLGATLAHKPAFALRPLWHGACAHTGPWSRLGAVADGVPLTPWALLGTRIVELARLALDSDDACLDWGAVAPGPRRGLAWMEMARGLLVHQVEVDPGTQRVLACRVVAPTEWNFHPQGEVAQRLALLDPEMPEWEITRRVNLLVAAFDPCVPFTIERLGSPARPALQEASHA
ncbi:MULTISPECIES: hydrogenase formation protein [Burkholderiales]|uniref:Hydrogenase formation protein n=1 Tax=Achromobacter veterisilvae TaxID=2069367 RepID=A0A446CST8_9BURK|nr:MULTISPECIES: hydrogenase formation protein [Burkholderiales]SSW70903.1 hypothetical protein AVE30378_04316 [Achromobacter veterisilvae]